jgi:predicted transcriptional regulator
VPEVVAYEPAVPVRSSIKPDYLVSLIDGRKYKTLKRHLATNGLTPTNIACAMG